MAQGISTAKFITASKTYARAVVEKANQNSNRYLTKSEAAALPKDLQDNFTNFRAKAKNGGSVGAEEFITHYGAYVETMVGLADKNGDGVLTRAEAAALPEDLRDNFTNFWNATIAAPPAAGHDLQTAAQRLDAIYNRQLPASSAFGEMVRKMDQELADGNIMTGVVGTASGKIAPGKVADADLTKWATALMSDYLKETDGDEAVGVKATVTDAAAAVQKAGYFLAIGNAYDTSNPDNINALIDGQYPVNDPDHLLGIKEVNAKLGDSLKAVVVSGTRDGAGAGYSELGLSAFVNTKTGEFVAYYGREGQP